MLTTILTEDDAFRRTLRYVMTTYNGSVKKEELNVYYSQATGVTDRRVGVRYSSSGQVAEVRETASYLYTARTVHRKTTSGWQKELQTFATEQYDIWSDAAPSSVQRSAVTSIPPQVVSVNPAFGSSVPNQEVRFIVRYSDYDRYANLSSGYVLIGPSLNPANNFYGYYVRSGNRFYLRKEDNSGSAGYCTPGQAVYLENAVAKVNCRRVAVRAVTGQPDALDVYWAVSFKAPYAGRLNNIYLNSIDVRGMNSGWKTMGGWLVKGTAAAAPTLKSFSPTSGSKCAEDSGYGYPVTFNEVASDVNGYEDLKYVHLMFSGAQGSSTVYYYAPGNRIYFSGVGICTPGSNKVLTNGLVSIHCEYTTVRQAGPFLEVSWRVGFRNLFTGQATVYTSITDRGGLRSGWRQSGTWTVDSCW